MSYLKKSNSHILKSLKLLKIHKRTYLGGVSNGGISLDHFVSLKHGLIFLKCFLEVSENKDLKLRIQNLVSIVKHKLYSLPRNQEDENSIVELEHAYEELGQDMQNVVINPGTGDYDTLFPGILKDWYCFRRTRDLIDDKIKKLVTSSCKADQIAPMMKELEELRKKLTSLQPSFDYVIYALKEDKEEIFAALTTFLEKAACLVYLSFVGKWNADMLVSVRKKLSLLVEETDELKEMSISLGIIFKDDLEYDIDTSLSLLKRHEEFYKGTINEATHKDHIMSLKHGIEFLKWFPELYSNRDLRRRSILLARNVKQKLESLTYEMGEESLNDAYGDMRDEMKNVIIKPAVDEYDTLFQEFSLREYYVEGDKGFLLDKITILVTSDCKVGQIALLKKELEDLWRMLSLLKPLCLFFLDRDRRGNWVKFIENTFLIVHHRATFVIFLSFIGKMDLEMALSVKGNISKTIKETDVLEMYTTILSQRYYDYFFSKRLLLLENLIWFLKENVESLNDASSKLYEALVDITSIIDGLPEEMFLRKSHLLPTPISQAILGHSIPIISSCYVEIIEVDISAELKCVLELIKPIKSEAREMKLYYFPRVDDLGFLKCFSRHLEDLMKNKDISLKEEIEAVHLEVHSLLSLAKGTNQELDGTPWTDAINMAYQAEYIIDHYLVRDCEDVELISYLSKIIEQLKNIIPDVSSKSLPSQDVAVTSKPQVLDTTPQVSNNDSIVGLHKEIRVIKEYLLKGENELDVISIFGMAGVGKTTLASTLYKSSIVADHFNIIAWCSVSQTYQNRNVLLSILDQVNASGKNQTSDDQELADNLYRQLKKHRYLIVLDDVWDTTLWNYLKYYLPNDREGSRILITTRNRDISDQIGSKVYELDRLSKEESWELFQKKMCGKENLSEDLLKISKEIVEDCKGLPISIVIIAGILSDMERTEEKWNQIAKSVSSLVLSDPQGECKAILELSYNHLPSHLRSCFLYLATIPEDSEIYVDKMISLWIGEGFVHDTELDSAEELAKKYMGDLIVKSLVVPVRERYRGGVKTFRLHDLLHDFCLDKAKEKHFFTMLDRRESPPLEDPRRLIMIPSISGLDFSYHSVRTMICFDQLEDGQMKKMILDRLMVLLKVLLVAEVSTKDLTYISMLVDLRYLQLGLSLWAMWVLPASLRKLQNLQILILTSRDRIVVPDFIWDMVKLRHVHITPQASFKIDDNRLQNSSFLSEKLRFLYVARVSWGSNWLTKFACLQKLSCVIVFDDDVRGNQYPNIRFNGQLTSLKVKNSTSLTKFGIKPKLGRLLE